MRRLTPAFALLLALAGMPAQPLAGASVAPGPDLRITEILPDPDAALGQREFVEVWNAGNATVELQGWKLRDAPTASGSVNTFTFPAWSLRPNGRVVVWGGGAADARGPAWGNPTAWNNAGDGASLLDASGALVDWAGYGAATAPAGFEAHLSAKPDKALSTELEEGGWVAHAPTPGAAPGATAGELTLQVANVAPRAGFASLPAAARPGTTLAIELAVGDDNGAADIEAWNLTSNGMVVASGAGVPSGPVQVPVPSGTQWVLAVQARDAGGLSAATVATVPLRASDLVALLPAGGLAFPAIAPGATQAAVAGSVLLHNTGGAVLRPLLDVSDFSGPATLPAAGHLQVGVGEAGNVTWMPYAGPLMALPALGPGQSASLWLRLVGLPVPLPAGAYGTSFTVVAG